MPTQVAPAIEVPMVDGETEAEAGSETAKAALGLTAEPKLERPPPRGT